MRRPLPIWVWQVLSAGVVAGAFALVALLFVEPRLGLIAWWLFVLPVLPLLWVVAPGIWRNVCPMAALNQYPRLLGFSRALTVPAWLRSKAFLIQCVLYFVLISTRAPFLDHNGPAVGTMMIVALGAAFAGGVVFKGKSGWCGTFCPLMPIQRLYGQTPLVVVPNAHCQPCVGCTKNCYDFNPRLAAIADANDEDVGYVSQRKLFAGAFPGFVVAFFTVPNSQVGAAANLGMSLVHYYGETAAYMLASLGLFFLIEALVPLTTVLLIAIFGALGLNLHNALRFSTAFNVHKPRWLFLLECAVVGAITVVFLVRTRRNELAATALASAPAADLGVRPGAGLRTAIAGTAHGPEVEFHPHGPRVVAVAGTSLLDVAEHAELPLEVGCRMGVCGADPVMVLEGMEHLSAPGSDERATLERLGLGEGCRMACCARVSGPVTVSLDTSAAPRAAPVRIGVDYNRSVRAVVVLGNGIAGVTAADHVRRRHPDCTIDVIADELHPLHNRMGVSRLIYGRSAMVGLHLLPDDWYERNRITCWLNTQAHEIDLEGRAVVLGTSERLPYDRLILAMGSSATLPRIDGLDRNGVFVVRRADDAISSARTRSGTVATGRSSRAAVSSVSRPRTRCTSSDCASPSSTVRRGS
jgi:nitrite reductase (NADH) large subunit